MSCGGGGYGPSEERAPQRVPEDVRESWVSRERAGSVYRVALTEALEADMAATELLRRG